MSSPREIPEPTEDGGDELPSAERQDDLVLPRHEIPGGNGEAVQADTSGAQGRPVEEAAPDEGAGDGADEGADDGVVEESDAELDKESDEELDEKSDERTGSPRRVTLDVGRSTARGHRAEKARDHDAGPGLAGGLSIAQRGNGPSRTGQGRLRTRLAAWRAGRTARAARPPVRFTDLGADDPVEPDRAVDVWFLMALAAVGVATTGYLAGRGGMVAAGGIMALSVAGALASIAGHPPSRWLWGTVLGIGALAIGVIIALDGLWAPLGVILAGAALFASSAVRRQIGPPTCDVSRKVKRALDSMPGVRCIEAPEGVGLPVVVNELTGQASLVGQIRAEVSDMSSSRAYRDFRRRYGAACRRGENLRGVLVVADLHDFTPLAVVDEGRVVVLTGIDDLRKALMQTIHGAR